MVWLLLLLSSYFQFFSRLLTNVCGGRELPQRYRGMSVLCSLAQRSSGHSNQQSTLSGTSHYTHIWHEVMMSFSLLIYDATDVTDVTDVMM